MANDWKHFRRGPQRDAFQSGVTLIEILVAVGIVGVMAVLLFPVYKNTTANVKSKTCISNLRAIGGAQALYSADNDGWFTPNRAEEIGVGTVFWCQELVPYLSGDARLPFPKVSKCKTLTCPAATKPVEQDPWGYESSYVEKLAYSQNVSLGGGKNLSGYPPVQRRATVIRPSKMVLVVEGNKVNSASWSFESPSTTNYRHNGTINLLFVDGHVESSRYPVTPEAGNKHYNWQIGYENN